VPAEWLSDVRQAHGRTLLTLVDHLPGEAAEALWNWRPAANPVRPIYCCEVKSVPIHPDAQRRFRVMTTSKQLQRALEFPWTVDRVPPSRKRRVEREYTGPARISGSSGTGKTMCGPESSRLLARARPHARVFTHHLL